ncbi:hypothetical protein GTA08_BOTSDO12687 [Botryosphaeria dothidea]|uniref:Uncharacterized protein n=1 Tax=Botryosphaeria dothidea TaxID=55169 RepID=A0A8H4J6J2_9PEZI|nr:hypothetical protein GTA08_BOTSDO12687 [Botryosphaeria dothidea]
MSNYRADYALYEKQQKALTNLATYIQDSIATNLLPYISNTDSDNHPWTYLTTLKAKLAPTNEATDLELEQQYNQLKRGPSNQNIEKWLQSWEEVYTKAKQRDLPQVKDDRPVRDFLLSLRGIDSTYSQMELHLLRGQETKLTLHKAVEDYRQHLRIENLEKPSKSSKHSAFPATFKGKEQENNEKPPCICGLNHWYKDCFYLNEDIRPKHWNPNKAAQTRVNEKLKDPKIKARIDYALNREKER